ncbi:MULTISPECIES: hypothetical protein [unclassified Pseudoalteromonas]|uniref:DUF7716 domain-containing protein n=1 Tax=unclassified Pseudoalteromonas TaxID=194690 RepID=UPI000AD46AC9|nr:MULTISPECIES: hypothetical protein [unclassified Pseudoalteromonas]MBW4966325.1 hypothetical protein [Pseudoalteromonas sp. CR1]TMN89780.1 hypothetical protein CWB62_12090 [Pseudoalteromonas sp. S408]TMO11887.1 hypothetical protein CWB57_04340 [Pseudoalteromonas sp. S186]
MSTDILITLDKVLLKIETLPWDYALYIPAVDTVWDERMMCMILDPEETEDPDDDPEIAKRNGLKYALSISDVQDVSENLNAQIKDVEQEFLIAAVKYYYDKGAFITLS